MPVCPSVCLPVCLPACLSVCLPACLSVCLPVCLSVCLCVQNSLLHFSSIPPEHRVVTKLKAKPLSSRSIKLSWKLPRLTSETVAYAILWAELDVDDEERKAVVANGSTSFTFDNLRPHRLYSFRVQTMLVEGPGGSTDKVTARPFSDKPGKAPRNLILQYSNDSVSSGKQSRS